MTVRKWAGVVLLSVCAGLVSAPQAAGEWVLLGERNVDRTMDHDVIVVTAREGDFNRIALRVQGALVEFSKVEVHYANGKTQEVNMRERVGAGGESRAIDLNGTERVIERVAFNYKTDDATGPKAVVQLWGLD